MPKSKSYQSSVVTDQIAALADWSKVMGAALRNQGNPIAYMPKLAEAGESEEDEGWDGNTLELSKLDTYSRSELEEQFRSAVSSADDAGTVGDLVAIICQGDLLSQMERAFRARHSTSVRLRMQAAGRYQGHGHENGIFRQNMMNFIKYILRQAAK